jgi:hypothetical protein
MSNFLDFAEMAFSLQDAMEDELQAAYRSKERDLTVALDKSVIALAALVQLYPEPVRVGVIDVIVDSLRARTGGAA